MHVINNMQIAAMPLSTKFAPNLPTIDSSGALDV